MTTTATEHAGLPAIARPSQRFPFVAAFAIGVVAVLILGAGVLYAYDRQFEGRILPGVHVGSVDLSGLWPDEASARLNAAYADLGSGQLVLSGGGSQSSVSYASLGRQLDADGLVADAAAVGRAGSPFDRVIGNAKTALRGVELAPRVVLDEAKVAAAVETAARPLEREPVDATVVAAETGFETTPSVAGQSADVNSAVDAATAKLSALEAAARVEVAIPVAVREPSFTTDEATAATAAADLIAKDLKITDGDNSWTIKASTIEKWIKITPTVDGRYVPIIQIANVKAGLAPVATKILQKPVEASFLVAKSGAVFGVTAARNGRALDLDTTTTRVVEALFSRTTNADVPSVAAIVVVTKPKLSTEEAQKVAPLMKRISTWTTYFPISERNHFGANIWLPARFINGTVVAPGGTFDFWHVVGPITTARGFGKGGAIINGQTDPQGAIGGGICSCSTTIFNAALRAGMQMHARRNHFYYIDRYPIGLDATVFISSGGSRQTMSWTNDTPYPVLIRGINTRSGGRGYVRFDIYSVPNGRRVVIGSPTIRNISRAWDSRVETSTLPKGTTKRIESPVDGKDVWRTVSVYQDGKLIRQKTYYSHYARITGIVLVGTG
jgi:vancomycin resistance protein YoaR